MMLTLIDIFSWILYGMIDRIGGTLIIILREALNLYL